jgi:hypothetical protein
MALDNFQATAVVSVSVGLPLVIWQTAKIVRDGESVTTDDAGQVTSRTNRREQPSRLWRGVAYNIGITLVLVAYCLWAFLRPQISNGPTTRHSPSLDFPRRRMKTPRHVGI